jgi:hypothetical protein
VVASTRAHRLIYSESTDELLDKTCVDFDIGSILRLRSFKRHVARRKPSHRPLRRNDSRGHKNMKQRLPNNADIIMVYSGPVNSVVQKKRCTLFVDSVKCLTMDV